jgi:hypothetical protein
MVELPRYARVVRSLANGMHPYILLIPGITESPAIRRIESPTVPIQDLLSKARVRIEPGDGYVWVDDEAPAIVLVEGYYRRGDPCDLYLDLLHELTHLRQLADGQNIWDESIGYVDRPTEIEGYSVAVEEGRRLGLSKPEIIRHLSNPWMSPQDVLRLYNNVDQFLADGHRP